MEGLVSSIEEEPDLKNRMRDTLRRKRDLRYILFESSEEAERETMKKIISEFPHWEVVRLDSEPSSVKNVTALTSLGETFAGVNNVKISEEEMKDLVKEIMITQER